MRTDYGLYVVAVICFIIAALPYTNEFLKLESPMGLTFTVIFAALGLILIILGYSLRPKPIISIPKAPKPALPPSPPPKEPAPLTPPQKETVKTEKKKAKTRRKGTRRRRKKA